MVYQRSSSLTTVSSLLSHRPVSLVMERSPRFESLILREKKTVFTNLKKQILEEPSVHLEIRFLGQCSKYFPLLLKIPEIFLAMSHMHMHTHARAHTHTHTHTHTHYSDLTRIVTVLTTQDLALCVDQQHHWGCLLYIQHIRPHPRPTESKSAF